MLTELCLRSNAVWGYDETFIEACRDELALTTSAMQSSYLQVAEPFSLEWLRSPSRVSLLSSLSCLSTQPIYGAGPEQFCFGGR